MKENIHFVVQFNHTSTNVVTALVANFIFRCSQKYFLSAVHMIEKYWNSLLESSGKERCSYNDCTVVEYQPLPILQFRLMSSLFMLFQCFIHFHSTYWLDIIWSLVLVFFSWIRQYECQTCQDSKTRLHKWWGSIMLHLFLPALVASIWLKVAQGICVLRFWGNHVVVVPLQPICRGSYMRCLSAWVGSTSYSLLSLSLARSLLQCLGWWVTTSWVLFF